MAILNQISQLLLALSILVLIHELGHFLAAKIFKTRVEKFYLFFNPYFSLYKKQIGETLYGIGWLPIGGYVKIAGMVDESMDTEQLKKPAQKWEFRAKPTWQRLIIILAGVFMNLILAWFIYSMIVFSEGEKFLENDKVSGIQITNKDIASLVGLENGDKIISANGKKFEKFFDTYEGVLMADNIVVNRGNKDTVLVVPPDFISSYKNLGGGLFYLPAHPFIISEIPENSININSGLQKNDILLSVNSQKIDYFYNAKPIFENLKDTEVSAKILRNKDTLSMNLKINPEGLLQVYSGPSFADLESVGALNFTENKYSFFSSFIRGGELGYRKVISYFAQLKKIFSPESGAYKNVGSVITMGSLFPKQWNWIAFWELTAFLSIMLAVLNVLPIPALDGGHAVFIVYEMITRRPPSQKILEYAQIIGFVLLLSIMALALGNDIFKLFS